MGEEKSKEIITHTNVHKNGQMIYEIIMNMKTRKQNRMRGTNI